MPADGCLPACLSASGRDRAGAEAGGRRAAARPAAEQPAGRPAPAAQAPVPNGQQSVLSRGVARGADRSAKKKISLDAVCPRRGRARAGPGRAQPARRRGRGEGGSLQSAAVIMSDSAGRTPRSSRSSEPASEPPGPRFMSRSSPAAISARPRPARRPFSPPASCELSPPCAIRFPR